MEDSRFITLAKIADLIAAGEEIRVIDDKTGNDITPTVLAQIILEQQRGGQNLSSVPGLLRELIKKGTSSVLDFLEKPVFGHLGLISLTEEKAKEIIGRLVKIGKVSMGERDNILKGLLAKAEDSKRMLESFIKETIARMNIPSRAELEKLEGEVRELNKRLSAST